MLGRRLFANCAICAVGVAVGLVAGAQQSSAQQSPPGLTRKILSTTDLPGGKLACVEVMAEIEAGALVARHTHPGVESAYVLEGGGTLSVKGEPDLTIKPGDAFQVAAEVPHSLLNGGQKTRIFLTYAVEKDKPLASPAPG
jgi:quercetin dioxygenase-like cupin family protein